MGFKIDLYLLTHPTFAECFGFVCQLVEKTCQQGHAPLIKLESEQAANSLDELLWSFKDTSFIPHQRDGLDSISAGSGQGVPLLIQCRLTEKPAGLDELNAARLLQIVPNQPNLLQLARQHYRFYQQQGCQLATHQIKK